MEKRRGIILGVIMALMAYAATNLRSEQEIALVGPTAEMEAEAVYQSWETGSLLMDPEDSALPGMVDIRGAVVTLEGATLTLELTLREIPKWIEINLDGNEEGALEYFWGALIDTDGDGAADRSLGILHRHTGGRTEAASMSNGFDGWAWDGAESVGEIVYAIDGNTLALTATGDWIESMETDALVSVMSAVTQEGVLWSDAVDAAE